MLSARADVTFWSTPTAVMLALRGSFAPFTQNICAPGFVGRMPAQSGCRRNTLMTSRVSFFDSGPSADQISERRFGLQYRHHALNTA